MTLLFLSVDTIPGVRIIRIILLVGAIFFGISAFALLIFPKAFIELLGFAVNEPLVWAMMLIAITLIALTGNMAMVSISASQFGVRIAGWTMMLAAFGLGAFSLLIPAEYNWFNLTYAGIGFAFSIAYFSQLARSLSGRS
ncbi:MAG: hypothetical protein RI590_05530 [Microbacteriaceae bacterium]|nr:hypothetical protein [Microbacteriaceae bacterium]MDR9444374.1 hypothetical protein [Microbacteriaceae bacterium]